MTPAFRASQLHASLGGVEVLHGVGLEKAQQRLASMAHSGAAERQLLDDIAAGFQSLLASDDHVFVGGVANLAGEQTFETVNETIGSVVLQDRQPRPWWIGFIVAFALLMVFFFAVAWLLQSASLKLASVRSEL